MHTFPSGYTAGTGTGASEGGRGGSPQDGRFECSWSAGGQPSSVGTLVVFTCSPARRRWRTPAASMRKPRLFALPRSHAPAGGCRVSPPPQLTIGVPHLGHEAALGRAVGVVLGEGEACVEEAALAAGGGGGGLRDKRAECMRL